MRHLHIDCPCGLGGDMLLAALCAIARRAGTPVDLDALSAALARGGAPVRLALVDERRHGLAGVRLAVDAATDQPLRHLPEIEALIRGTDLPESVVSRSLAAFHRLAEAEAEAHGIPVGDVHFHEVGAVDTVVDILGAFLALETLGVKRVTCSALPWFTGTVCCEHGEISLPAPATAALLRGKPVYRTEFTKELITPTGAVLLDQIVQDWAGENGPAGTGDAAGPVGRLLADAVSYGTMHLPHGLRLFLTESASDGETASSLKTESIWLLETNIDHLTGEEIGHCYDALLAAGALDVLYLPGVMKKNRPGGAFQVQCRDADLGAVQEAFFRNTLTLGIRRTRVERVVLPRRAETLGTPFGDIAAKRFATPDGTEHVSAEYEALKALAEKTGRTVAEMKYLMERADG